MIKNFRSSFLVISILATLATGCRSTEDYKNFAKAGENFSKASDTLLETASNIAINTTSERLLSDRMLQSGKASNEDNQKFVERFTELSQKDKERLELIKELREHNQLLQSYFAKLIELASSDTPAQTQKSVDNIASNLQASGTRLLNFNKLGKLPSITKIVLDARIRGAIRNELEKRKETIHREITIQQKLLDVVADSMEHDVKVMRDLQETRLVLQPLLNNESKLGDDWIKTRNQVMTQDAGVVATINYASASLQEFRDMFIASIEGDVTSRRLNKFIKETNKFSELVLNNQ